LDLPAGVWQTGNTGRTVSRSNLKWRKGFERVLPELKADHQRRIEILKHAQDLINEALAA
jgi:hypothetical protein